MLLQYSVNETYTCCFVFGLNLWNGGFVAGNGSNNSPNDLTSDPGCCVKFSDSISTPIQRRNSLSNLSDTTMGSLKNRQGWK